MSIKAIHCYSQSHNDITIRTNHVNCDWSIILQGPRCPVRAQIAAKLQKVNDWQQTKISEVWMVTDSHHLHEATSIWHRTRGSSIWKESPCTPYQIHIDARLFKQKWILNLSRRFEFQHGQRRYILQGVIQYWNCPATCKLQHVHSQQSLTDTCIVVMPRFTKSKCRRTTIFLHWKHLEWFCNQPVSVKILLSSKISSLRSKFRNFLLGYLKTNILNLKKKRGLNPCRNM